MANHFIKPEFLRPHYSTKLWRGYQSYIKKFYTQKVFEDICDELQIPVDFVLGDNNWVSNEFLFEFLNLLKKKTGNPNVAFEAGLYSLDVEAINPFEYALIRHIGPYLFFKSVPAQMSKMSLINKSSLLKASPGHFRIEVRPTGPDRSHADACKNTIGLFQATQKIYSLDKIEIDHSKCMHLGSEACVFEITYSARSFWKKRILGALGILGAALLGPRFVYPSTDQVSSGLFSSAMGFSVLACSAAYYFRARYKELVRFNRNYYDETHKKTLELYESKVKLDRRYQESNLLHKLSADLVRLNSSIEVIKGCLDALEARFGVKRSLVMLVSGDGTRLYPQEVRGFTNDSELIYSLNLAYPSDKNNPQVFSNILDRGQTILIEDISKFKDGLKKSNQTLIDMLEVKSLIVSPIQDAKAKYGLLIIGSIKTDRSLNNDDKHFIENTTRMLSLFFQNARNFEKEQTLRNLFQKYVPSLVLQGLDSLKNQSEGYLLPKNNAVTSVFIDLRNFTSLSERIAPERVVDILNIYTEFITKIIADEGGIVDNLVGDGIVVFFPANDVQRSIHARQALTAVIKILGNLESLNEMLLAKGYARVSLGIGIHSGNAIVGNMGCDRKLNYTAIGDTINVAARLQAITKEYRDVTPFAKEGSAIISEAVLKRAPFDIPLEDLGSIQVRGKKDTIRTFLLDTAMAVRILKQNKIEDMSKEALETLVGPPSVNDRNQSRKSDLKKKAS